MQISILAGCQRLLTAAAVASLIVAPANAATGVKGQGSSNEPKSPSASTQASVELPTAKQPTLYPRSNYVWPFAAGPVYGEVQASRADAPGVLHTMVGSFDMTRSLPNFPAELRTSNKLGTLGAQYFLLQVSPEAFGDGTFDDLKSRITGMGGVFVQEMPVAAFIVRMNQGALGAVQGFSSILALEPYHPAFKLSPEIGRVPLRDPMKAVSDVYSLELRLFPGEDAAVVAKALTAIGVKVSKTYSDTVFVDANRTKLAAIAGLEPVMAINEDLPLFVNAEETTSTVQTGRWNNGAKPYNDQGIDGRCGNTACTSTQVMMILDSGIQVDAGDLSNTRADGASVTPIGVAHRKVVFYGTTNAFGGSGDALGCDSNTKGGSTHGHTVAATALGNATAVPIGYGAGWQAKDLNNNPWDIDGLAPRAKLVAFDAGVTPLTGSCLDPANDGIFPGDLYATPSSGSLGVGYTTHGARIVNFSWGSNSNVYSSNSIDVDDFIFDKGDAMVFIAAGNNGFDTGTDGEGEPRTVGTPATTKNGICVGASNNADDQFNVNLPNTRPTFSALGPVAGGVSGLNSGGRVAPILMAPGNDAGGMGLASEFNCRTNDDDGNNPVECDIVQGLSGTSFASPAAAGAGLLVRDYFAQGFYPDGTASNPGNSSDVVGNISGALLKAVLIASADYMEDTAASPGKGGALDLPFRFSDEQGYGRIQLTSALPLQTYPQAVTGLIVADGGIAGGINSTTLNTNLPSGGSTLTSINVCDTSQPMSIGLAWIEASGADLVKNLDLELLAPSGRKYIGNFYTDNENANDYAVATGIFNEVLDAGEGCDYTGQPWPPNSTGAIDNSAFSLPVQGCANASADTKNPTEGIHLSPDPANNGIVDIVGTAVNEGSDNQLETGAWTLSVKAGTFTGTQNYALAVSGGVCLGSAVRIQKVAANNQLAGGTFVCNDSAVITVNEIATAGDPAGLLTPSEIASRITLQVVSAGVDLAFGTPDDVVVDSEASPALTDIDGASPGLRFDSSAILLSDGTAPDPGNGVLDVRSGQQIRVTYQDEQPFGTTDVNAKRVNTGSVDCRASINAGGVEFGQFGKNAFTFVSGGCEKDARGYFTFGFPDRYMDAGELVGYLVAFQSAEIGITLQDVTVSLKAVEPDVDSPLDCKPGSSTCADPNRANNALSAHLTVLDSPKVLGLLPSGSIATPSFTIQAATSITGVQQADMVLGVSAKTAGKGVESFAVQRETLNADPQSFFYSTDFPTGGSEAVGGYDINNNELLELTTNDPRGFTNDYVFETRSYSNATAGGFNTTAGLQAPWNFDTNNGGFTSGLQNGARSGSATIALWGEDKNFNGKLDGFCTLDTDNPCTQGTPSNTCQRCSNDITVPCVGVNPPECGGNACSNLGTCSYTLDEDRDTANGVLNANWGTAGGCGWQTKGTIATGGIWHTGRIDITTLPNCLASGTTASRCQNYERQPIGDLNGDPYWWEMLLTPVVNKVNRCTAISLPECPRIDAIGDPVYQVAITDWAWNMAFDIGDQNSGLVVEFDTDIDKIDGADFYNDGSLTQFPLFGPQGALAGGNAPLQGGFSMFAPISRCVDTDGNGTLDHCTRANGTACTSDGVCTGNDLNGALGNSRTGDNGCIFEGKTAGVIKTKEPYGLATPKDDDVANSYCLRSDSLSTVDKSVPCTVGNNGYCTAVGAPYTTCAAGNAGIDEFVQANGPGRNFGIQSVNGPDMRFTTLEDFYGDTGLRFQGAVGFYNVEPTSSSLSPNVSGYGVGIDDMVISWKETRLDEDSTLCAGSGECADLEVKSTVAYDGNSLLNLTVTDRTPYDTTNNKNDCDGNGSYLDVVDDQDCNNNGALDVTVKVTSSAEPTGEIAVLDAISGGSPVYKANFPYSSSYDSPGTIFVARSGTVNPVVVANYEDRNDGTGSKCKNALDPSQQGILVAQATIVLSAGRISLKSYLMVLDGPGDDDGFADANETLKLYVSFTNKSGLDVDDLVAALGTTDPNIECIGTPIIQIGSLLNKGFNDIGTQGSPIGPFFKFKVKGTVARATVDEILQATLNISLRSNKFDVITRSMPLTLDLDLNASGSASPAPFLETFEAATGFGLFELSTLDANKRSVVESNGYRCQYNDPDGPFSNSTGNADCFLGFVGDPTAGVNDWHIQKFNAANCNSGRAFGGVQSLRWGACAATATTPVRDSGRFKQLDAVKTTAPLNMPLTSANPELTFKHQVSLVDNRGIGNIDAGETADRFIVQVQLADSVGNPLGNWIKILPYENEYDEVGTDDFSNCTFDPIDDGNDEDDFFVPTDPQRRTGPSSTCFPEFAFARAGQTDWRLDFLVTDIGLAFDGPGLQGNQGAGFRNPGTWVQPRFSLNAFAGKRLRFRFLGTSIELGTSQLWDEFFARDNVVTDDGVFIDDVQVDAALSDFLTLSVDTATVAGTPCGVCSAIVPNLTTTPTPPLSGPGQIVTLNAKNSTVNVCNNGALQYKFWIDANANGVLGDGLDSVERDWTDSSVFIDAPQQTTQYGVEVRCSSAPLCGQSLSPARTTSLVTVTCPSTGTVKALFAAVLKVDKVSGVSGTPAEPDFNVNVNWTPSATVDIVKGNLITLRSSGGNYVGTVSSCLGGNNFTGTLINDATDPGSGGGQYFLARPATATFCNQVLSYSSGSVKEIAGRDAEIGNTAPSCP